MASQKETWSDALQTAFGAHICEAWPKFDLCNCVRTACSLNPVEICGGNRLFCRALKIYAPLPEGML